MPAAHVESTASPDEIPAQSLRPLLEALPTPALVLEADGRVRVVNQHAARLLGYAASELVGMACDVFVPERLRERYREQRRACIESAPEQPAPDRDFALLTNDGSELPVESSLGRLRTSAGVLGLATFSSDVSAAQKSAEKFAVTQQGRAEEALRASEEKFAKAFHATPYSVSIIDLETDCYVDVNEGFERLFEVRKDQVVGHKVSELKLWADPEQRARVLALMREHGSVRDYPANGRTLSGEARQGAVSCDTIEIAGRKCLLTFARDITKQVEIERAKTELEVQLREAQKLEALGTLAGGIAHDFNNILAAIVAYTDLIHIDHEDADAVKTYVEELRHAGNRARDLVQQILTFSRRQKHERKPVRLDIAVREAIKLLRSTLPATIEIESQIEPEGPIVLADPSQIHQIVMNLGTNAAHAMRDRTGRLFVSLQAVDISDVTARTRTDLRPGRNVCLTVRDTGSGMDAYTRKRIFEPFFTTKAPGEGTGLGLAVVHGIVREHEGSIAVESRLGQGTTFELHFPEHPSELSSDAELATTLQRGQGEHILLVEDEPALRHSVSRLMERLGYRVSSCASPIEALQLFGTEPRTFDLVLTDITMPGMTGVDMAREMLARQPSARIVVMSGFTATWTPESLQALGILKLLSKPITAAALSSAIREALDRDHRLAAAI